MTAAQAKEHEDKHTGIIRKEKIRNVGSKAQKQENLTQGVHSNKSSRLCYKAEPGSLSHHLSAIFLLLSSATVSLLPLSSPPSANKSMKTNPKLPGLGGCSNSGSTY